MTIKIIQSISAPLLKTATAIYYGGQAVNLVDADGNDIIGTLPSAPSVVGSISDQSLVVGDDAVTIDLSTVFSGGTSYAISPDDAAGVTLAGAIITIDPQAALAATAISATASNTNGPSDPVVFTVTITNGATVPAQMGAPTLTGGALSATLTLNTVPNDGGDAIIRYDYEVTLSTDTDFSDPVAQGNTSTPLVDIDIDPLAAGTYIARSWAVNSIGDAEPSDASLPATVAEAVYTTTLTPLPRDYLVIDGDMANGTNAADVPLSGNSPNAPEGTDIMVQLVDHTTFEVVHPEVQVGTTDANGDWSGVYPSAAVGIIWMVPEARPAGSGQTTRGSERLKIGIKAAAEQQSQMHQGFLNPGAEPKDTIGANDYNFQMWWNGSDGISTQPRIFIDDARAALNTDPVNSSIPAMAALCNAAASGIAVEIGFITKSGSWANRPLMENDGGDRPWSCVTEMADALHTSLNLPIGVFDFQHSQGLSDGFRSLCAIMWGTDDLGNPIPEIDTANEFTPYGGSGNGDLFITDIVHIWAHAFPELLTGRAKLADIGTAIMRHYNDADEKEAIDAVRYGTARLEPIHSVHGDKILQTGGGLAVHMMGERDTGANDVGVHFYDDSNRWGMAGDLRARAFLTLTGLGLINPARGTFDQFQFLSDRVRVSCSNGYNFTSNALQDGVTTKFPDDPLTDAVTPGGRRVVGFIWGNGDWAMNTEIVDVNGDPATSGPYIDVFPNAGQTINFATRLYFQHIVPTYTTTDLPFQDAKVHDYFPIFDDPIGTVFNGWPVESQNAESVAAMIAANDLVDPDAGIVFTSISGGLPIPSYTSQCLDPNNFAFEFRVRRNTNSNMSLLGFGTTANQYGNIVAVSDGSIAFNLENGSAGDPLYGTDLDSDPGVFPENTVRRIWIAGDATQCNLWIEDENGVMQAANSGNFGTLTMDGGLPTYNANRLFQAISNQSGSSSGDFVHCKYWAEYLEPDDVLGTPDYEVYSDGNGGFQTTPPIVAVPVTSGGVTYQVMGVSSISTSADGVPHVVGTGMTIQSQDPAPEMVTPLFGADTGMRNGIVVNQTNTGEGVNQTLDGRMTGGISTLPTFPITLPTEGEVISIISDLAASDPRYGVGEFRGFTFSDTAQTAGHYAPPLMHWPGKTFVNGVSVDLDLVKSAMTSPDGTLVASAEVPTHAELTQYLDNGVLLGSALSWSTGSTTGGYQSALPRGFTGDSNYGVNPARVVHSALMKAALDTTAGAEVDELLKFLVHFGIQMYDALMPVGLGPDGGHNWHQQIPIAVALIAQGRTTELGTLLADLPGNLGGQPFRVDQDFLDALTPTYGVIDLGNGAANYPQHWSICTVQAVSGNTVTIERPAGLDGTWWSPQGASIMRVSDSETRLIVSVADGTTSNPILEVSPDNPFSVGDEYVLPDRYTPVIGDAEWSGRTSTVGRAGYMPGVGSSYRGFNTNQWGDAAICARILGLTGAGYEDWDTMVDWVKRKAYFDYPECQNTNLSIVVNTTKWLPFTSIAGVGKDFDEAMWTAYATTLSLDNS